MTTLLTEEDRKEALSQVYVKALAAPGGLHDVGAGAGP